MAEGGPSPIGVVGGSGFYEFLAEARDVEVQTPWGPPSAAVAVGEVDGREVAFIPRHGRGHRFPPHRVPYRANMWALRYLGVRQVLAPSAVGSLRPDLAPGRMVVPDQIVDRTWGRASTYSDAGEGPDDGVVHVPFADPYCPRGRAAVLAAAEELGHGPFDGGTLVVINGPRFSTRAESQWHAALGGALVGMTAMPEAALARELGLCYTGVALVTDYDAGIEGGESVTQEEVFRVMGANVARVRAVLARVIPELSGASGAPQCACAQGIAGQRLPYPLP